MSSDNENYIQISEKGFSGLIIREYDEIRDEKETVNNNRRITTELLRILDDQGRE